MSRIGKLPVVIPSGVNIKVEAQQIIVSGAKGTMQMPLMPGIDVVTNGNQIELQKLEESKSVDSYSGLLRTLINNMVIGVTEGFKKVLLIEGVGYKVNMNGKNLAISVGYSSTVDFSLPEKVQATVEGNNKIILESIDKELLGLTAAKIRQVRKPEPYKGKGIRYENEYIQRKVGKAGGKK